MFHFVIPGEPVPAGRPRAYINKALGRAGVHMPGKSSAWQATAAMLMRSEWGGRAPISAAVRAHLQFARYFESQLPCHPEIYNQDVLGKLFDR